MVNFLTFHNDPNAIQQAVQSSLEGCDYRDVSEYVVTVRDKLSTDDFGGAQYGIYVTVSHPHGLYMTECRNIEAALHRLEARVPTTRVPFTPLSSAVNP